MGVVTNTMPFLNNSAVNRGMLLYIFAYAEKGSLGIVLLQTIQHKGRGCLMRTIIKSQIKTFLITRHLPGKGGVDPAKPPWCLNEVHGTNVQDFFRSRRLLSLRP